MTKGFQVFIGTWRDIHGAMSAMRTVLVDGDVTQYHDHRTPEGENIVFVEYESAHLLAPLDWPTHAAAVLPFLANPEPVGMEVSA